MNTLSFFPSANVAANYLRLIFLLTINFQFLNIAFSQICDSSHSQVDIQITTDNYAHETAWSLKDESGYIYHAVDFNELANQQTYLYNFCVPTNACLTFSIFDNFGDGLFPPAAYRVVLDSSEVASGGGFTSEEHVQFNCTAGQSCATALPVTTGQHLAPRPETWYEFIPTASGIYRISTCGTPCDTRVYVYGDCNPGSINDDHEGTSFYDNQQGGCDSNAVVLGFFQVDLLYKIRLGQTELSCADDSIPFSIGYEGAITGCTDPTSCNYDPLATISDDSCIPQGDVRCPAGPDLSIRQDILRHTFYTDVLDNTDDCLIGEGCLTGYGKRHVIRFATQIENIGELDYVVGPEEENQGQFTFDNCHQHFHYEGYAEYILFDESGRQLPASFKNGFCILDLQCEGGGHQTYSCEYMGIAAGCEDVYSADLDCQWIDITDLPAGDYTFVTRVNWNNRPDLAGRVEKDTANNWAQVCFNLQWNDNQPLVQQLTDCTPYVDCTGTTYGNTTRDCNQDCGGAAIYGDLDDDGVPTLTDVRAYLQYVTEETTAVPCNDLNADDALTIYDAALLANCLNFTAGHVHPDGSLHEHCNFPAGIYNSTERASLSITHINWEAGWIDVGLRNPESAVTGYQFELTGVQIASVTNLVDNEIYNPMLRAHITSGMVLGLASDQRAVPKSATVQPLVRIDILNFQSDTVCISSITEVINQRYEQIDKIIDNGCRIRTVSSVENSDLDVMINVSPNPFTEEIILRILNDFSRNLSVDVFDVNGRRVASYNLNIPHTLRINTKDFPAGLYFYRLSDGEQIQVGRLGMKL